MQPYTDDRIRENVISRIGHQYDQMLNHASGALNGIESHAQVFKQSAEQFLESMTALKTLYEIPDLIRLSEDSVRDFLDAIKEKKASTAGSAIVRLARTQKQCVDLLRSGLPAKSSGKQGEAMGEMFLSFSDEIMDSVGLEKLCEDFQQVVREKIDQGLSDQVSHGDAKRLLKLSEEILAVARSKGKVPPSMIAACLSQAPLGALKDETILSSVWEMSACVGTLERGLSAGSSLYASSLLGKNGQQSLEAELRQIKEDVVAARSEIAKIEPQLRGLLVKEVENDDEIRMKIATPVLLLGHGPRVMDSVVQGTGIVTLASTAGSYSPNYWVAATVMCFLYLGLSWLRDATDKVKNR